MDTKKKWFKLQVPALFCLECMGLWARSTGMLVCSDTPVENGFKAAGRPRTNGGADSEKTKVSF